MQRALELSRRFSRTQLNVLSGYAGHDHRFRFIDKEKVEFRFLSSHLLDQDRACLKSRLSGTSITQVEAEACLPAIAGRK